MLIDIKTPDSCDTCMFRAANGCRYNAMHGGRVGCPFVLDAEATYNKAAVNCGVRHQVVIAIEELSELQKELTKLLRGFDNMDKVTEEIADCIICIEQLIQLYDLHDGVYGEHSRKLERLKERLETGTFK